MNTNRIRRAAGMCLAASISVAAGSTAIANVPFAAPSSVRQPAPMPAADVRVLTPEARFLLLMTILRGLNKS